MTRMITFYMRLLRLAFATFVLVFLFPFVTLIIYVDYYSPFLVI